MKRLLMCICAVLCFLCTFSGCVAESHTDDKNERHEANVTIDKFYTLDDFSEIVPGISTVKDVEAIAPIGVIAPLESGGMECFFPMEDGKQISILFRGDVRENWDSLIAAEIRISNSQVIMGN